MSKIIRVQARFKTVDELEEVCRALNLRYQRGQNLTYTGWQGRKRVIKDGLLIFNHQISRFGDVAFDSVTKQFVIDDMDVDEVTMGTDRSTVEARHAAQRQVNPLHALQTKHAEIVVTQFLHQHNTPYTFTPGPDGRGGRFDYQGETSDGQQGTVSVSIATDGLAQTSVTGISGPTCGDLASPVAAALGPVSEETITVAYEHARLAAWEREPAREKQWQP